jgi:type II secretory ATPase GspE/PulE/Tfp pilus assembly ATPase PilB-like protein/pSer/pThr/pTyr-binding forkhead associated (FHA) protein
MDRPYIQINTAAGRKQLVLGKDPISIGRHHENKLVLADSMASRFHCVIEKVPDGYLIRDLGASNPTRVNGRVIKSALLAPGDEILVGSTKLVLVTPGEAGLDGDPPSAQDTLAGRKGKKGKPVAPVEELDELEEVEELSESDLVEDDLVDEPLAMDGGDESVIDDSDYEHSLRRLAEAAAAKPFGETDVALLNPRGQVVHAAGQTPPTGAPRQMVDLFRLLLLVCFRHRVTDIHVEPKNNSYSIRLRVDGIMVDAAKLPTPIGTKLTALVKILSDIDPSQRSTIQEGHFGARVPGAAPGQPGGQNGTRRVDYRVSFAPAVFGQKLVVRVLDAANSPGRLQDLKVPAWMDKDLNRAIGQDSGMVLVCGPTGSGKTSSLYALIRSLKLSERNVVTIEDPVEIQIDGVTQIPVDEEKGKSFSTLLRSVLRQDPDIILVGEIRDAETARIAMQAAITGHLVFSTVHTKDAFGTVFRLLDLGVEPYLLAQGLHVVLAQRLVRQLCSFCKKAQPITPEQKERMGPVSEGVTQLYEPVGCYRCMSTGYAGRRAIFELLTTNPKFREAVVRNPSPQQLEEALLNTSYERLDRNGFQLAAQGVCSFEEIDRAVGM